MEILALFIKFALLYGIVLMLVALGGMFSERSGIINIALEGIMVIGAMAGVVASIDLAGAGLFVKVAGSILAAGVAGMVYAFLLAFASVSLKADQTIGGTALNILATAIAMVIAKRVNSSTGKISDSARLVYSYEGFVYNIGGVTVNIFFIVGIVLLVLSYVILYKTRLGLRLRACGEHPQAADSLGINVYKMRYIGVLISGFLGGIGGLAYILPANPNWDFKYGIAGMGFLALAVMIFGQWKPFKIFFAAMFFAVFKSLADIADSIPLLSSLRWPKEIYNMMPFIASMIVLALTSGKSRAPKAEGIPYDKGQR
ncbi:MAG: ABC transporter permease [Clostridiales bacterium]|nr:ABC transporter permease [Clostridiales bacterium]